MGFDDQNTSGPVNPRPERVHSDNYVLNEIKRDLVDSTDSFGSLVVKNTRNQLDLASHYNFSPERLRLFRNGSREFPQYNTVSQFNDSPDTWDLQPDAGDSMRIESTESGTYVVNFAMQASWAFELNQDLQSGDVFRVGPYNGSDGWFIEQRGTDHGPKQADIIESVAGSETTLASNVDLERPFTDWTRMESLFNWYGVGNQTWKQTYTDSGQQYNDTLTNTSTDGERGPETGNLTLRYEIEADANTTGLELHGGSMGMIVRGDPVSLARSKPTPKKISLPGDGADTWDPFYAIRLDPADRNVNAQFAAVDIVDYSANATIELAAISFDASKTDASGWSTPEYHHDSNSAIQETTNVDQVARNSDGSVVNLGSGTKPGGFTEGSALDVGGGGSAGSSSTVNQGRQEQKALLSSDHLVFLARTGTAGDLWFQWDVDQNW